MAGELANQIALITGAGRGIGRATALRLARAGCDLALVARTQSELEAVAEEAGRSGAHALVIPADVTEDAQVEALVQRTLVQLGSISILINNAGVAPPRRVHGKAAIAEWDRMLATCLRAPMLLSHLVLPDMLTHQTGAIVNVASTAGRHVREGEASYAAAKAGLVVFSRALFAEVRNSGVKVVAVCPGYVDTGFVPPNRRVDRTKFLRPEDVADAILGVLTTPAHACPTEVVLEPQFDPERR
jgi:3-oxoacyl-[acyl-carrier protein] reductase